MRVHDLARPEQAIAAAAAACSNWGRWGPGDVRGTLNSLTDDKRVEGAGLVRRGVSFSLARVRLFQSEPPWGCL